MREFAALRRSQNQPAPESGQAPHPLFTGLHRGNDGCAIRTGFKNCLLADGRAIRNGFKNCLLAEVGNDCAP